MPDHPGAVRFGDEDEASLTVVFGPGGEPSTPRQVTVRFPEKGKSLSEDQRAELDAFARDLRPELERRRRDGEPKLEVTVTAGATTASPGRRSRLPTRASPPSSPRCPTASGGWHRSRIGR